MIRTVLLILLVVSYFGLGIFDCWSGNYRTGVASVLLGIVQALLFWRAL